VTHACFDILDGDVVVAQECQFAPGVLRHGIAYQDCDALLRHSFTEFSAGPFLIIDDP
jgi:hypothetical protein